VPQEAIDALEKPTWAEVMQLLRDQPSRRFRIEVETDSLVAADDQQEQAARTQFLETAGQFLNQAVQAGAQHPEMVPLLGQMLMFGIRGFRVGRDLEDAFEQFVEDADKKAKAPQQGPPPSPDMIKVQGELKLKEQAQQADIQLRQAQAAAEQKRADADQQHRHLMEVAAAQTDAHHASQTNQADALKAHLDAGLQQQGDQMRAMVDVLIARINALAKIEAAGEAKGATQNTAAEQHQEEQGA
jgi:hypothetical protein